MPFPFKETRYVLSHSEGILPSRELSFSILCFCVSFTPLPSPFKETRYVLTPLSGILRSRELTSSICGGKLFSILVLPIVGIDTSVCKKGPHISTNHNGHITYFGYEICQVCLHSIVSVVGTVHYILFILCNHRTLMTYNANLMAILNKWKAFYYSK